MEEFYEVVRAHVQSGGTEAEEKEHSRKEAFLDKTFRFTDRGRFRCIGTPLLHHDERHQLAARRRYVVPIAMRLCGVETS